MITYGITVGRFQVAALHAGHHNLFRVMQSRHDRVVVFIAIPRTGASARNPLDFETRRRMIQNLYPDFIVAPIRDKRSDETWSGVLDSKISEITGKLRTGVVLYGGPNSFLEQYKGTHNTELLSFQTGGARLGEKMNVSGSNQRYDIARTVIDDKNWRAGVIYGVTNQFPRVFFTVDCAILFRRVDGGVDVLLGRKPNETEFRFIGGFVNQGETLEKAVKREVYEETAVDLQNVEFIDSYPVNDWRYQKDSDGKITTCFHIGWASSYSAKPGDDIEEVRWFRSESMPKVVGEHVMLCERFKKIINARFYFDSEDLSKGKCNSDELIQIGD